MGNRLLPLALVVAAAIADGRGAHEAAFYLLVAAVPAAAISALSAFGELVELPGRARGEVAARANALLSALALVSVLVGAAARGQATEGVPPVGTSALVACLALFVAQALVALVAPAAADEQRAQPHEERERLAEAA